MKNRQIVVVISADVEWQVAEDCFPGSQINNSIYNQWFEQKINGNEVIFYHGGWGKISAAATAQYAIDRWKPDLVINLGTCGGFVGEIVKGDIILAEETVVYDIFERMGDPDEAINFYTARLDLSFLKFPLPFSVQRRRLISADRDIDPMEIDMLRKKFGAAAADWESGAIAWVASRNKVPCVILRGVTDIVDENDGEAYGNWGLFVDRTRGVMKRLIENLPSLIDHIQ